MRVSRMTFLLMLVLMLLFAESCKRGKGDEKPNAANEIKENETKIPLSKQSSPFTREYYDSLEQVIPMSTLNLIKENVQGWQLVNLSYYQDDWLDLYKDKGNLPYYLTGFLQDGINFVAVILMNNENEIGVFVIHVLKDNQVAVFELEKYQSYGLQKADMLPLQIGLYKETGPDIQQGIYLNNFEKNGLIFTWNGSEYVKKDDEE